MSNPQSVWNKLFKICTYAFAIVGFVLVAGYFAVKLGLTNTKGIVDSQHDYFKDQTLDPDSPQATAWKQSEEWQVLKEAILKDKDSIALAAHQADIPARMIVAPLVVEQIRLFYSNREIFKAIFAPLKILGNQSQFSWGVMGIKQETARQIEDNLKDHSSPWYLGPKYEHLLDFPSSATSTAMTAEPDTDSERFARLTDEHDRSYSYLYAALCIKELEAQWEKAGFPIRDRPDIVSTLFNIGFANSHPNAHPQAGGAEIDIGTTTYSFGGLAGIFYASDELTDIFPR